MDEKDGPTWQAYEPGRDPELDKILRRRFGPGHDRPCIRPEIITCARWECQKAGRCQHGAQPSPAPPGRQADG